MYAGTLLTDADNLFVKAARLMQDESALVRVR
jgi:hypothetical protein